MLAGVGTTVQLNSASEAPSSVIAEAVSLSAPAHITMLSVLVA